MENRIERCDNCLGYKTIQPMGGINQKCDVCNGLGYIEVSVNTEISKSVDTEGAYTVAKRVSLKTKRKKNEI